MDDDLEALVINEQELDRKLVADILAAYVRLDKDTSNISPQEGWLGLGSDLKILVYLLARKAMILLRFDLESEGATAGEVARDTNLKLGAVNPLLRRMYAEGIVDRSRDRRYFIPNDAIERVRERVKEGK